MLGREKWPIHQRMSSAGIRTIESAEWAITARHALENPWSGMDCSHEVERESSCRKDLRIKGFPALPAPCQISPAGRAYPRPCPLQERDSEWLAREHPAAGWPSAPAHRW